MLDTVNLNHIVTREGGWDTAADWKVRMMMLEMIMIMMVMVVIPTGVKCPKEEKTSSQCCLPSKHQLYWVGDGGCPSFRCETNLLNITPKTVFVCCENTFFGKKNQICIC